jgi:uncharacterized protein YutE (UPF0331/DUF86 family)
MPTADDVIRGKASIIERTLRRMKEVYAADPGLKSFTHIDAMTLNIERACQAAIDAAMHLTAREHLGLPRNSADAFRLLHRAGFLSEDTARAMVAMTGFRNIAIHEYRELDISVLHAVAAERWTSIVDFCRELGLTIRP